MPTFAYWDMRGLVEPIRYLLHFKGIEFEDKRYRFKSIKIEPTYFPNFSQLSDVWQKEKFQLNLDFPNLPYYIDDNVRLTQSITILRYLAKKHDLAGQTEEELVRAELAEQQLIDLRTNYIRTCCSPEFENIKEEFIRNVPAQLKLFSAFLGNRKFIAGDNITYADFLAYETFDFHRLLIPTVFNEFPNLKTYVNRMENLPELQEYFKSSTYKRWPIFTPYAVFGGKGPEPKRV